MTLLSCGNFFSSFHFVSLPYLPVSEEFSSKSTNVAPHVQIPNRQKLMVHSVPSWTHLHGSGLDFHKMLLMADFLIFQYGIIHIPFSTDTEMLIEHSIIQISEIKCKLVIKGVLGKEKRKSSCTDDRWWQTQNLKSSLPWQIPKEVAQGIEQYV